MHLDVKAIDCQVQLNKVGHFLLNLNNWIYITHEKYILNR